jgi:hypothetical protein
MNVGSASTAMASIPPTCKRPMHQQFSTKLHNVHITHPSVEPQIQSPEDSSAEFSIDLHASSGLQNCNLFSAISEAIT